MLLPLCVESHIFFVDETDDRPAEKGRLHGVCVPREGKVDVCLWEYFFAPMAGVVCQQYFEFSVGSLHGFAEVEGASERFLIAFPVMRS